MKKSLRIARDVSLVVVFCIGFLGLVWLANFLQNNPDEQTSSEFSDYRVSADKAAQGNDFGATLENLRAMVRNDPYDGRAQYQLASTIFSRVTIDEYVAAESNPDEPPSSLENQNTINQPNALPPAPADAESPQSTATLFEQAIYEFQRAEKHPRYRQRSQFHLAVLWAIKGDDDAALGSLKNFVEGGGFTRFGLDRVEQFGLNDLRSDDQSKLKLHADPRFERLVALEMENRIAAGMHRSFENRSRTPDYLRSRHSGGDGSSASAMNQPKVGLWNFLQRLNDYLIPYRIKLVNFIRELFK